MAINGATSRCQLACHQCLLNTLASYLFWSPPNMVHHRGCPLACLHRGCCNPGCPGRLSHTCTRKRRGLLLERLGLHQGQGSNPTGSGSAKVPPLALHPCTDVSISVRVPQVAKHPCICRPRWNSNPTQGPFVTRMALY